MINSDDLSAVRTIYKFFERINYAYMNQRVLTRPETEVFPEFQALHNNLKPLYPIYRLLFTLFWQGHPADDAVLRRALPPELVEALVTTGLLAQNSRRQWQTPSLAIIPTQGLYLVVSLPGQYPTAVKPRTEPHHFGADSIWLIKALPASLAQQSVLDFGSGTGAHALVCAARGAARVVGLEQTAEAAAVARFNVALNNFSQVVEIRESHLFSALKDGETFDFITAAPVFNPALGQDAPTKEEVEDSVLLRRIFEQLPSRLSEHGSGAIFCNAIGNQFSINFNQAHLENLAQEHKLLLCAYVGDKIPLADYISVFLERKLAWARPDLSSEARQQALASWQKTLQQQDIPADFVYEQLVRFWKGHGEFGLTHMPIYNPELTDPLVMKTTVAQLRA